MYFKQLLILFLNIYILSSNANTTEIFNTYKQNTLRYTKQLDNGFSDTIPLRVVTLNLGLLKTPSEVPNFHQRSNILFEVISTFLSNENPDIVFFQEAWVSGDPKNVDRIRKAANQEGYLSLQEQLENSKNNISSQAKNGLEVLIKKEILSKENLTKIGFSKISKSAMATLAGYDRGLLHATIELKTGKKVLISTSHFTPNLAWPTYNQYSTRQKQVREISNLIKKFSKKTDYTIFGADLNFSPEFEYKINDDRKMDANSSIWSENTKNYTLLFQKSGLIDTYKIINSDPGFTQDRELNPMANISPSTDGEPEQRLDYIWVAPNQSSSSIKIENSKLIFDLPLINSDSEIIKAESYNGELFISDHFGVMTELLIK